MTRTFNYSNLKNMSWDGEILRYIAAIYKSAGKQELYLKQKPQVLDKLIEIAKIQSTESSNAIEGIITTDIRIRALVEEKTAPRNRAEQEIAGYRDVLSLIHENYDYIPVNRNYILQLHKILYSSMANPMAGRTKNVQNYISASFPDGHSEVLFTPLAPFETAEALDQICAEYNRVTGNGEVEPLIAIPVFIHDFLCIHPFNDGNGRISRLLTSLLLYQNGFEIGKYISIEARIEKSKKEYYQSLIDSEHGWHEGKDNFIPFVKYFLKIVLEAFQEFEQRAELVTEKTQAIPMVRAAVKQLIGRFTKQDIIRLCPTLSMSSIERALRELTAVKEIERQGSGRSTYYIRLR